MTPFGQCFTDFFPRACGQSCRGATRAAKFGWRPLGIPTLPPRPETGRGARDKRRGLQKHVPPPYRPPLSAISSSVLAKTGKGQPRKRSSPAGGEAGSKGQPLSACWGPAPRVPCPGAQGSAQCRRSAPPRGAGRGQQGALRGCAWEPAPPRRAPAHGHGHGHTWDTRTRTRAHMGHTDTHTLTGHARAWGTHTRTHRAHTHTRGDTHTSVRAHTHAHGHSQVCAALGAPRRCPRAALRECAYHALRNLLNTTMNCQHFFRMLVPLIRAGFIFRSRVPEL